MANVKFLSFLVLLDLVCTAILDLELKQQQEMEDGYRTVPGHVLMRGKAKVKVKSLSRVRLFDPMDCSQLLSSSVHGILQARILEWVAISFSQGIFPAQGSNPGFPTLEADALTSEPRGKPTRGSPRGEAGEGKLTPNTLRMRSKKRVSPGEEVVADLFTLVDEGSFFEIVCLKEIYDKFK